MGREPGSVDARVRVGPVRRLAPQKPAARAASTRPPSGPDDAYEPSAPLRRGGYRGRILRIGLPLAALATIAAVFWLSRPSYNKSNFDLATGLKLEAGMEVANPRYMGTTSNNEPFLIRADAARPDGPDPNQIALDKVVGDITLDDGKEATLTAAAGVWERSTNRLRLSGGVVLKTSDGYQMETEAMLANIDSREIVTDGDVVGRGPVGSIEAGRARFQDAEEGVAYFEDGVKVLITKLVESRATGE